MSWVTVKVPYAPEPLACMRRSGITSRSKWASFSRNQTSCNSIGPRGPAVIAFWLSATGQPALVVSFFLSLMAYSFLVMDQYLMRLIIALIRQLIQTINRIVHVIYSSNNRFNGFDAGET